MSRANIPTTTTKTISQICVAAALPVNLQDAMEQGIVYACMRFRSPDDKTSQFAQTHKHQVKVLTAHACTQLHSHFLLYFEGSPSPTFHSPSLSLSPTSAFHLCSRALRLRQKWVCTRICVCVKFLSRATFCFVIYSVCYFKHIHFAPLQLAARPMPLPLSPSPPLVASRLWACNCYCFHLRNT